MSDYARDLIKNSIKAIPDFPKQGVVFRDVTSLMEDASAFSAALELLTAPYRNIGLTKVVGTESRGFIFGAPVANMLGVGFAPIRKAGKLPRETIGENYALEYGHDRLELHVDSIRPSDRVLLVDDLLATGGTIEASAKLIRRLGGTVDHACFVVSLPDLGGEAKLEEIGLHVHYLCQFEGD